MEKGLHNLKPATGHTRDRKRVGRGPGSGTGKTSGRGQKGQKSRSGSHNMRAGFEGGQMPLYMRLGKKRGGHHKMSMPIGPFRTYNQPVNVEQLSVFEDGADVNAVTLKHAGILRNNNHPVKILGRGELAVKVNVTVHAVSDGARQKIEAAGGTITLIEGPKPHGRMAGINKKVTAARAAAGLSAAGAPAGAASSDAPAEVAPPVEESPAGAAETGTPPTGPEETSAE